MEECRRYFIELLGGVEWKIMMENRRKEEIASFEETIKWGSSKIR